MKAGFIDNDVGTAWINDSNKISAMLTSLMQYLG
jgi:hypothetical protein